jgi:hypothetical protein
MLFGFIIGCWQLLENSDEGSGSSVIMMPHWREVTCWFGSSSCILRESLTRSMFSRGYILQSKISSVSLERTCGLKVIV